MRADPRVDAVSPEEVAAAWVVERSTRVRVAQLMGVRRYPHSDCGRCKPDDPHCPADVELIVEGRARYAGWMLAKVLTRGVW